ncbi:hypothetical protein DAEQUDRAFT_477890 [Daedalea quercina L-15889]|uniref:Cerato-platanin n=1 Tax=Daedalea quercina L-15889 TaxID=1314783 RepID=A0A165MW44_9APHY|nr:hypothetical protein DAEQUDRAFT_477890 [Daedalea quercina L-15889]
MIHFLTLFSLAALAASSFALAQTSSNRSYVVYGDAQQLENTSASVDTLTCGPTLASEGYTTIGSIPGNLTAFSNVTSADSPLCGQCVVLGRDGREVTVRIVDTYTESGFDLTGEVFGALVGNGPLPGIVSAEILKGPYKC